MKTVHIKGKFECKDCDYVTTAQPNLYNHIRFVHEKYKPNKCEHCDAAYGYKRDLIKHRLKLHPEVAVDQD